MHKTGFDFNQLDPLFNLRGDVDADYILNSESTVLSWKESQRKFTKIARDRKEGIDSGNYIPPTLSDTYTKGLQGRLPVTNNKMSPNRVYSPRGDRK